ncbi:hypothetical protein [Vibrio owensii]|uniref:Uncharacterized protein n=1 Tax=Vibrio owensii CAIM 1854 = LMG 25443 TaxID=1229493 RepID=A0A0C1ZN17_9VIBR|nr:hypothetical protein [Vibrio owensii]KIF54381.1 hypothetical protein H735_04890 [Vibrio owensii CAIM 1854 = LMG 25443]
MFVAGFAAGSIFVCGFIEGVIFAGSVVVVADEQPEASIRKINGIDFIFTFISPLNKKTY